MGFEDSLEVVLEWEGTYDKDPDDTGGETCFGISRVHAPSWEGWKLVDGLKATNVPTSSWRSNAALMNAVNRFYRQWWDSLSLDGIQPKLAGVVFGASVNQGKGRVVKWLQESLVELGGASLVADGKIGPATLEGCKWVANRGLTDALIDKLNMKRVRAYNQTAKARPENAKFLAGWLNRLFSGA